MQQDEERENLAKEHSESHNATIEIFDATEDALREAQDVIARSRVRLQEARRKYEERLNGPADIEPN